MQEDPQIRKFYSFIFLFVFVFEMSVAEFLTCLLQLHEKFARDEKFTYESVCVCICVWGVGGGGCCNINKSIKTDIGAVVRSINFDVVKLFDLSHSTTKPTKKLCAQRRLRPAWACAWISPGVSETLLLCAHIILLVLSCADLFVICVKADVVCF